MPNHLGEAHDGKLVEPRQELHALGSHPRASQPYEPNVGDALPQGARHACAVMVP